MPQPPYPLHPSIADKIHPDYVAFYNEHLLNKQQVHFQPVEASRVGGDIIPGRGPFLPVGSTKDYSIPRVESEGPNVPVRVFSPEGSAPAGGWPVFIYYHGGGWVLGNIDTENTVCTNICNRAKCVVVTVDYRLAPEYPYPAAVHDSWEAIIWILNPSTIKELNLNTLKISTGGSSAGGNLAAIMCQRAATRKKLKFLLQVLIVPVTDNTADTSNSAKWRECEWVPALPAAKMLWYRNHYLPDKATWGDAEASPLLWEGDWAALPPAVIVVGGMDVLCEEGEKFGEKLKGAGVAAEVHVIDKYPHPFLAMDGALQAGRDAITFMVEGLKSVM